MKSIYILFLKKILKIDRFCWRYWASQMPRFFELLKWILFVDFVYKSAKAACSCRSRTSRSRFSRVPTCCLWKRSRWMVRCDQIRFQSSSQICLISVFVSWKMSFPSRTLSASIVGTRSWKIGFGVEFCQFWDKKKIDKMFLKKLFLKTAWH